MGSLAYIALVLALAVGIYLLIRYQRERQKELSRMEALRDSRLYKDIYPLILRAAARGRRLRPHSRPKRWRCNR